MKRSSLRAIERTGSQNPSTKAAGTQAGTNAAPVRLVSARAFGLGLILALGLCAILPYNDYYVAATYLSGNFFPIGAVGAILVLTLGVNPLLIALGQARRVWNPSEIITVWTMILVVSGIPSSGLMRYLIPHIVAPHYFASQENHWDGLVLARLPSRLLVTDPVAVQAFFGGLPRGIAIPWVAWAVPLSWWALFVLCLFTAFFCLSALLRRQWVENEHLAFPLVQLPLLLAETPEPGQKINSLLRSPLLWAGVMLVTGLHTTKALHLFYPSIPDIPTSWHSSNFLTSRPWNALNDMVFAIYPLVVGFTYLLSTEIAFSLWFFYLAVKLQALIALLNAWDTSSASGGGICMEPSFVAYQEAGGAVMLTLWVLWLARSHIKDIWRKAIRGDKEVDDSREPLSYRFAFFGLIGSYLGMFLWLTCVAEVNAGMAFGLLLGSFVIFILLSWLVAQGGLLFIQQTFAPSQLVTMLVGASPFSGSTLATAALTEHIGWQDAREFMLPSLLNADKAAAEVKLSARSLTRALALCVLLAVVVSGASSIWLPYTHGGGLALKNHWMYVDAPQSPLNWAAAQVRDPQHPSVSTFLNMGGGALFVVILFLCRTALPAFSLHPAGFLVAGSYPMYMLWFSILLGWLVKGPVMRYGGVGGYRRLLPFFLGLILGDCLNALVWVGIGLATGKGYALMPG